MLMFKVKSPDNANKVIGFGLMDVCALVSSNALSPQKWLKLYSFHICIQDVHHSHLGQEIGCCEVLSWFSPVLLGNC
jgi:hypothetical protein